MQGNTTHLSGDVATSSVGAANGVCPLNGSSVVSQTYLPYGDTSNYGMMKMSGATPQPLGVATPGTLGLPSDAGHVHPLPSGSVRGIYSAANAGSVTCSLSYTPSTLASVSTSGLASTLVIVGAVSAEAYSVGVTCPCYASLWIDSTQTGPLMRATAFLGSGQYVSMSPVARVSVGAGGHVVSLDLSSTEGCACTVDAGNSMLVVTEYTN
jgi:hypothetical protein